MYERALPAPRVVLATVDGPQLAGTIGVDAEVWPHRVVDASTGLLVLMGLSAEGVAKYCEARGWTVRRVRP